MTVNVDDFGDAPDQFTDPDDDTPRHPVDRARLTDPDGHAAWVAASMPPAGPERAGGPPTPAAPAPHGRGHQEPGKGQEPRPRPPGREPPPRPGGPELPRLADYGPARSTERPRKPPERGHKSGPAKR